MGERGVTTALMAKLAGELLVGPNVCALRAVPRARGLWRELVPRVRARSAGRECVPRLPRLRPGSRCHGRSACQQPGKCAPIARPKLRERGLYNVLAVSLVPCLARRRHRQRSDRDHRIRRPSWARRAIPPPSCKGEHDEVVPGCSVLLPSRAGRTALPMESCNRNRKGHLRYIVEARDIGRRPPVRTLGVSTRIAEKCSLRQPLRRWSVAQSHARGSRNKLVSPPARYDSISKAGFAIAD